MERTALESFKAAVASVLSNTFLFGGSVVLSIHIVLTFFRMHGLVLTLAFVMFWMVSVTAYFKWNGQQTKRKTASKPPVPQGNSKKPAAAWSERQSA